MHKFPIFRRQNDRPATRRSQSRRVSLVESLEGRQLLSNFTAMDVKKDVAEIQGAHMGMKADGGGGVGQHIGMEADGGGGVGQHIG
jgi:hypothetical protein